MLRVTVLGNLGSDAELRYSTKGSPIAGFRVAVNQVRMGANGQREESTEWFQVSVAGRQAEYAARLQKGQWVLVAGRLQISHFQRRDGTPGIGFDVWADEIQNLSPRGVADAEDGHSHVGAGVGDRDEDTPAIEDDLPF